MWTQPDIDHVMIPVEELRALRSLMDENVFVASMDFCDKIDKLFNDPPPVAPSAWKESDEGPVPATTDGPAKGMHRPVSSQEIMERWTERFAPNDWIQEVIRGYEELPRIIRDVHAHRDDMDNKINDLEHYLELNDNDWSQEELATASQGIIEARRERRAAKDMINLTEPIMKALNNHKQLFNELRQARRSTEQAERYQDARTYRQRNKDSTMTEAFKAAGMITDVPPPS